MQRTALRLLAAIFVIGAGAGLTGVQNRLVRPASFPISFVDNRAFVGVQINGHGPFAFLLDTGSSSVTVEKPLAACLELLSTGGGTTEGAGESRVDYATVHLASVVLGRFSLGSMEVPVLDNEKLCRAIGFQKFDGVLGADIFKKNVVTIDFLRSRLIVEEAANFHPADEAIAIPMDLSEDETPLISAAINGIPGRYIVDTGDRSSLTLFGPFWRQNKLDRAIGPTATAMTGFGLGGPIRAIVGRPQNFSIGAIAIPSPVTRLSLQKAGVFTSSDYAGSIGMGILKRFTVSFDYSRKKIWLTKNDNFREGDLYDRSGVWIGVGGNGHLVVMDVVKGRPAAKAGILVGDVLLRVDDIVADQANLFALRALLKHPGIPEAKFHILRNGAHLTVPVQLMDLIAPPG